MECKERSLDALQKGAGSEYSRDDMVLLSFKIATQFHDKKWKIFSNFLVRCLLQGLLRIPDPANAEDYSESLQTSKMEDFLQKTPS